MDGDAEVALQPLALAVLVYLTIGGPREREHLAELFWSQSRNSFNSLSSALNRIRDAVPGAIWTNGVSEVGCDLASDVGDIGAAAEANDFARVTELYTAPFLAGLRLRKYSLEFEEWMLELRSSVAATVELSLLKQARGLLEAGHHVEAGKAAEQAWTIVNHDGIPSPDLFPAYHHLLALAASPVAQAVRAMAEEFGVELKVIEPIALSGRADLPEPELLLRPAASGPLPAEDLPIFGYGEVQQQIVAAVRGGPISTLLGLGGSGKTRLAADYFNAPATAAAFAHRYWVNLSEVSDAELVGPAVAAALGVQCTTDTDLASQIPPGEALVVLDNFEQVVSRSALVADLAARNPDLRLLVTSRVPLGLANESLITLSGLETSRTPGDSPAAQLFVSAARRAGARDDRLGPSTNDAIYDICVRLGGHPLALELAGSWVPMLSPSQILATLDHGNDLLESADFDDLRSMTLVLEESWATLAPTEQRTLMLLATFADGCSTGVLVYMPQLPIGSTRRLVQRSLINARLDGRLVLHPLIKDFAIAKLAEDSALDTEFRQLQSDWCCEHIAAAQSDLSSSGSSHTEVFESELANVTAAWTWGAKRGQWDLHRGAIAPLRDFFAESGRVAEGVTLFGVAIELLRSEPAHAKELLSELLEALAWLQSLGGDSSHASELLDHALSVCPDNQVELRTKILRTSGVIDLGAGRTDSASAKFAAALALLQDQTPSTLAGKLLHDHGQTFLFQGQVENARESFRAALDIGRKMKDPLMVARSYLTLGHIETEERPARAVVLLEEGQAVADEHDLEHISSYFPYALGLARMGLGEPVIAEELFTQSIEASASVRHPVQVCVGHVARAQSRRAQANHTGAIDDLRLATRLGQETDSWPYLMWAAIEAANVAAAVGRSTDLGLELLSLAMHHPATHETTRDEAVEALGTVYDVAPADCQPIDAAGDLRIDEVAERILELLSLARSKTTS